MKITYTKLNDNIPKKTNRTDRVMKKLHLGKYAETCIDVAVKFPSDLYTNEYYNDVMFDKLYDALNTVLPDFGTFGIFDGTYSFLYCVNSNTFNEHDIERTVHDVFRSLSEVEPYFAEIDEVNVLYGDAWYGEW